MAIPPLIHESFLTIRRVNYLQPGPIRPSLGISGYLLRGRGVRVYDGVCTWRYQHVRPLERIVRVLHSLRHSLEVIVGFNHRDPSRPKHAQSAARHADCGFHFPACSSEVIPPHFPRDYVIPIPDKSATVIIDGNYRETRSMFKFR